MAISIEMKTLTILDEAGNEKTYEIVDQQAREEIADHEGNTTSHVTATEKQTWNNKSNFSGAYNDLTNKPTIPTKTSQLTNDSGFLTSVPSEYVTKTELTAKNYLTSVPSEYVTETELEAKKYLTSIPSEYVTETELDNKGYAKQADVPTRVSQLNNDRNYVTGFELSELESVVVKTVNNLKPDANGNVDVVGEDGLLKHTHTWTDIAATYDDLVITSDGANHGGYVKVSDEVPTLAKLEEGGTVSFNDGNSIVTKNYPEGVITIVKVTNGAVVTYDGYPLVVIAFEDNMTFFGNTFGKGIHFTQDGIFITHTFTVNDYVLSSEITPIPPEYLPIDFLRQLILEVAGGGGESGLLDSNGNYLYDALQNKLIIKE